MKRLPIAFASLCLAAVLAGAPSFGSAQSATSWPTFHGNAQRSGASSVDGPISPDVANAYGLGLPPQQIRSSPIISSAGIAYVGANDGKLYAIGPSGPLSSGHWPFATSGPIESTPTLSPNQTMVYVGSDDQKIYAVAAGTGILQWSRTMGAAIKASAVISNDGAVLYVSDISGDIEAFNAITGVPIWGPVQRVGAIPGSLALSTDGKLLYASGAGGLVSISATGTTASSVVTTFATSGAGASTPALDTVGNIYATTTNGKLDSFAPTTSATSAPRWTFSTNGTVPATSSPAISNSIVVFGSDDRALYAVRASDGKAAWASFPVTGGPIKSSPAIANNNEVYVGSDDGYVYAFNLTTGQRNWSKFVSRDTAVPVESSPGIAPDGAMWVGTDAGYLLRFYVSPAPTTVPTNTAVPTFTDTSTPTSTATVSGTPPTAAPTVAGTPPTATPVVTDTPTGTPLATPSGGASLELSPATQAAGSASGVSAVGAGFAPGESVTVGYVANLVGGGTHVVQVTTQVFSNGTFLVSNLPVPDNVSPGTYDVTATGTQSQLLAGATLTVLSPGQSTSPSATPTLTDTGIPPTPVPSATTTLPLSLDKILILHKVKGKNVAIKTLRLKKKFDFFVLYHVTSAGAAAPSASLTITRNGKLLMKPKLRNQLLGRHPAFGVSLAFKSKADLGKLYAHFKLTMAGETVKRDRKFYVTAK